jgi:hypothetical protein
MLSSARFLAALLVAILVLPHTHSFAKSRTLLPDLTVDVSDLKYLCVGPALLRLYLTVNIRNAGKAAAVNPSPWTQWIVIRDKGGGPPPPALMWSESGPAQLPPGQFVTYKTLPILRQVPVFPGGRRVGVGFPQTYDVVCDVVADPSNSILESNENNNVHSNSLALNNKVKGMPPDFYPARCK